MRIVVAGAGFANKGAEAMAATLSEQLGRRIPGLELLMWDCPEAQAELASRAGLTPVIRPRPGGRVAKAAWLVRRAVTRGGLRMSHVANPRALWPDLTAASMLEAAGPFDAFVDISGFAYGDTWGAGPALSVLPLVRRAREHLLPVVFLPQAWGGFSRPRVRDAVLALTGGERTLVFSRDPRSTSHLEAAGVQPGAIATRSDVVFAFEGGTQERGAELLAVMGCRPERPIVAVTPNMRIYERSRGEGAENAYVQTLVALVRHCVDEHDAEVALLPFECAPVDRGTDDRRLCAMVRSEARRDEACHTSSAYISAADARAMTGRCEYMIGSRYHSLVFALSQGVPCTALSWSHKYAQLMELFGVPEDCVGHNQARDTADLVDAFEAGWARREVQRRHNLSVAAVLRADAHAVFDVTARFLLARGLP